MKGKRLDGGDTSTGDEVGDPRSIYVVVNTWDARPVYAIYKLDYPPFDDDHPCSSPPPPPPRRHPLASLEIEGGRTFVSVQTPRRKWIVAVGGRHSVVFDAETEEVIQGPDLLNAKDRPALVAVGDKVYALSSFPQVKGSLDFEPWFEVLDLSRARVVDGRLEDCSWEELPSPPCFPCQLAAHDFFRPPVVFVHSYVLLGSYMLVSFRSNQQHSTYAFHTVSAKWHKVVQAGSSSVKGLPFIGCPTPQHGGLYLGHRRSTGTRQTGPTVISAYSIKLSSCDKEEEADDDIELSVTEFPIRSSSEASDVVTGNHYSSLDKGAFCSLDWKSRKRVSRSWDDDILADEFHWSKKATLKLKTYQMEDNSLLHEEEEEEEEKEMLPAVKKTIAISEQPKQAFKIRTKSGGFISPAFLAVFNA